MNSGSSSVRHRIDSSTTSCPKLNSWNCCGFSVFFAAKNCQNAQINGTTSCLPPPRKGIGMMTYSAPPPQTPCTSPLPCAPRRPGPGPRCSTPAWPRRGSYGCVRTRPVARGPSRPLRRRGLFPGRHRLRGLGRRLGLGLEFSGFSMGRIFFGVKMGDEKGVGGELLLTW